MAVYFLLRATSVQNAKHIALGVVAAVAAAKEGIDAVLNYRETGRTTQGPHGVEALDFLATVAGAAVLWVCAP